MKPSMEQLEIAFGYAISAIYTGYIAAYVRLNNSRSPNRDMTIKIF